MRALVPVLLLVVAGPAAADPVAPIADVADQQIPIAQVQQVFDLSPTKSRVKVRLVLRHTGGSTDVSPHYHAYLALYRTEEQCDDLLAYDLGYSYAPVKAKKLSRGRFRFSRVADRFDKQTFEYERQVLVVDPSAAVAALEAKSCDDPATTEPIGVTVSSRKTVTTF